MVTHIEPKPKMSGALYSKDQWPITGTVASAPLGVDPKLTLLDSFVDRRTVRSCVPTDLKIVLSLIHFVMQPQQVGEDDNAGRLRKVSISAGALHPVEVFVFDGPDVFEPLLYIDGHDQFGAVPLRSDTLASAAVSSVKSILPEASGHYLLFVANRRHVDQAYDNPDSLLWRDAGAVLQSFSFLASASGLSFIPLGSTGQSLLDALCAPHSDFVAVGTALIGKAATQAAAFDS